MCTCLQVSYTSCTHTIYIYISNILEIVRTFLVVKTQYDDDDDDGYYADKDDDDGDDGDDDDDDDDDDGDGDCQIRLETCQKPTNKTQRPGSTNEQSGNGLYRGCTFLFPKCWKLVYSQLGR